MPVIGVNDLRTNNYLTVCLCLTPVLDLTSHMNRRAIGKIMPSQWCHPGRNKVWMYIDWFIPCTQIALRLQTKVLKDHTLGSLVANVDRERA